MEKNSLVVDTLDSVLNNKDYLLSILDSDYYFNEDHLFSVLSLTLNYYIATRDRMLNPTEEMIKAGYDKLNSRAMTKKEIDNIVTHGFLTHSFNGVERDYIARYGFDYWSKISKSEQLKLLHVRNGLKRLEYEVGKSLFLTYRQDANEQEIVDKELFISVPGTKTIYYAKHTPERFYLGPVGRESLENFPMVVGESKKEYLMRILKYQIDNRTRNVEVEELYEVAERVIDYYTKETSCISFIEIEGLIDKPIYSQHYGEGDGNNLVNYCDLMTNGRFHVCNAFTKEKDDTFETPYDMGNWVTLTTDVPTDNLSFANFPDLYDLKQLYLMQKGVPLGTKVDYFTCKEISPNDYYPDSIKRLYKNL